MNSNPITTSFMSNLEQITWPFSSVSSPKFPPRANLAANRSLSPPLPSTPCLALSLLQALAPLQHEARQVSLLAKKILFVFIYFLCVYEVMGKIPFRFLDI